MRGLTPFSSDYGASDMNYMYVGMGGEAARLSPILTVGIFTHNLGLGTHASWDPGQIGNALAFADVGADYYRLRSQGYGSNEAFGIVKYQLP